MPYRERLEADAELFAPGMPALLSLTIAVLGGIFAAALLDDGAGFLLGAALGAVAGSLLAARKRIAQLERAQHALLLELRAFRLDAERRFGRPAGGDGAPARDQPASSAAPVEAVQVEPVPPLPSAAHAAPLDAPAPSPLAPEPGFGSEPATEVEARGAAREQDQAPPAPSVGAAPTPHADLPAPRRPAAPDPLELFFTRVRGWLFGGNTIVRAGVLVLLVGVALLLRWAAEHAVFPIELRLSAAALIALALVAVGFRQRAARPGFGQSLQGAGVAALYLVVFFAFRRYELVPAGLAFALLIAIALGSGVLAVLQDAVSLVVIGQIGGFMAPVLASSGGGSHVALFSYYLLLNLLVFGVAWFRPWRALNLLGFAFTFGIGTTWGALQYRPELFVSSEPFLVAFFLLYSGIPVLYALRGRAQRHGWVDASLVFGTPLAVLLLQYAMVKDMPFGMAYSTLALAAYYLALSRALLRYAPERLRALVETFLAVGVGFASLAVPYGFDNHDLTGASWALEGAGLYWVGVRQKRWLSRYAGAALQLLAAGAVLYQRGDAHLADETYAIANARFLASALVGLGCLFVACVAYVQRRTLPAHEATGLQALIVVGLSFLWGALFHEVDRHVPDAWQPGVALALVAASLLALDTLGRRLFWLPSRFPGALFVLLLVPCLLSWEVALRVHPLGRGGGLAMPICVALVALYLRHFTKEVPALSRALHCAALWFVAAFCALEALHLVRDFAGLNDTWSVAALGCALSAVLLSALHGAARARFPFAQAPATYVVYAAGGIVAVLVLFTLSVSVDQGGDPAPLPFVPLLNPLELTQVFVLVAMLHWLCALPAHGAAGLAARGVAAPGLAALSFLALNAALARSVHQLARVPFQFERLWESTEMQVTLSVSWALLGLLFTVIGSRRSLRALWIAAAVLLGVLVLKLFTVDLAQLSTIAKIGTFLGVGFLLVLVGYFAPVPPPRAGGSAAQGGAS